METQKGTLLLVDDDEEIIMMLSRMLKDSADKILIAYNADEASEVLKRERVHAIVSDLKMPGITGIELLKKLRAEKNYVPFSVLSAFGIEDVTAEAIVSGALDFVEKPFDQESLKKLVNEMLAMGIDIEKNKERPDLHRYVENKMTIVRVKLGDFN